MEIFHLHDNEGYPSCAILPINIRHYSIILTPPVSRMKPAGVRFKTTKKASSFLCNLEYRSQLRTQTPILYLFCNLSRFCRAGLAFYSKMS